jgi:peptidyl-prolyl cis-trans isomerase SurA
MRASSAMKLLSLVCVGALAMATSAKAEAELRNGIAAIVNEAIITFQDVESYTLNAVDLLRRTYFNQPQVFRQKRAETMNDGLEQLLEKQLILAEFKSQGGALPDSIIDDEIKDKIRQRFGDRATLTKTLQAQSITYESYRQQIRDDIIYNYMRQKNVSSAILISPAKIERFFAMNESQFKLGDQVKLRMIVLKNPSPSGNDEVRKLAQEILTKIAEGASFAEMASIYSQGSAAAEGGEWGWVESKVLNKGLAEIAFGLKPGQLSSVIGVAREETGAYWIYHYDKQGAITSGHKYTSKDEFIEEKKLDGAASSTLPPQEFRLMLVEDKRPARTKALEEVRDEIEKTLIIQERARLQKKWIDRLKAKSFVRTFF